MQNLIPVINKVQEVFAKVDLPVKLDLPVIAVVGAQSTGKSSVLESIVGRDFLPRGSGIVTRRPLILQLQHLKEGNDYAIFGHKPTKTFADLEGLTAEIELETDRVAGRTKNVSPTPILLKIFSKDVLDLTLIDLPGLTKVPLPDQPANIEQQIRDMVVDVITNPNCIILAVSAGNTDLANSDSLKLAREVDPKGDRTIGVITKLDIMDRGTDAMEMIQGKTYPLKLGYVGVVCRSQQDITKKKPMSEALDAETAYFANSPIYGRIKERCGIKFLSKRLQKLLMAHILHCLPNLKNNVNALLQARIKELNSYGVDFVSENKDNLGTFLLYMISQFVTYYQTTIDGGCVKNITRELKGGARINYIFHVVFAGALRRIKALDGLSDDDIRTAIVNAKSLHPSIFIPESAFVTLIRIQIGKLLNPSLDCLNLVHEELRRIIVRPDLPELLRFQRLMSRLSEIMGDTLVRYMGFTEEMIRGLIRIEDAYINVNHPDVMTGTSAIMGMMQEKKIVPEKEKQQSLKKEEEEKYKQKQKSEEGKKDGAKAADAGESENGGGFLSSIFGSSKKAPLRESSKKADDIEAFFKPSTYADMMKDQVAGLGAVINAVYLQTLPSHMRADNPASSREIMETEIIKQLLKSYFRIVKKNICDLVPKAIMAFLVNKSKANAQNELVSALYAQQRVETLLEEDPLIYEKRVECKKMVAVLKESLAALNEINDVEL
jgi:dynamin 1-like protein